MVRLKGKKGISLITLVITIIVVIILAAVIILAFNKNNIQDSAVKARFMNNFRSVQEGIVLYQSQNIASLSTNVGDTIPTDDGKLTLEDKEAILNKVPTLATKIIELNPDKASLDEVNLYWVDEEKIGANDIPAGKENGYIIDADTNQLYDYKGEFFENLRWHTLDGGLTEGTTPGQVEEIWNGWVTLNLYYPKGSTDRQWRLGEEGELRNDPLLMWQSYTGPITIPLDRVKDVWIRYNINGKNTVVPPAGTILVDIQPDSYYPTMVDKVKVKIVYDETAETKEYRIGNSGWMPYNGEFNVTQNCVVEARAQKTENIYNEDGSLRLSRPVMGNDKVEIKNIQNSQNKPNILIPPTITLLNPRNDQEKAAVKISYPKTAANMVYKLNNGQEQTYSDVISIASWDTKVTAYYYDSENTKSPEAEITVKKGLLVPPVLKINAARNANEVASVTAIYPKNADKKYYKIDGGNYQEYTGVIAITKWDTKVTTYYLDKEDEASAEVSVTIPKPVDPQNPNPTEPTDPKYLEAPQIFKNAARSGSEIANVSAIYPDKAVNKCYRIDTYSYTNGHYVVNKGSEQTYTTNIPISSWGVRVVAYYYDSEHTKSNEASVYVEDLPAPTITRNAARFDSEVASVHVDYPEESVAPIYTLNYSDEMLYTEDVAIDKYGTVLTAYYYDADGVRSRKATITINENVTPPKEIPPEEDDEIPAPPQDAPVAPAIVESPTTKTQSAQITLDSVPSDATEIKIKVGRTGEYVEYTQAITITENTEIYAYYRTSQGEKSQVAFKQITNIQQPSDDPNDTSKKPYLVINANPYPYKGAPKTQSVEVSLTYSDADTVEYSTDGVIYNTYEGEFNVTQNGRIYARAINAHGVTEASLDINNIGDVIKPPQKPKNIPIQINADPDPRVSINKVAQVIVTIDYGSAATEKYYSFGPNDKQLPYTGAITITQNTTIYAYAKGENAIGQASLKIDNLLDGIAKPVIKTNPAANKTASKVKVTIDYDKYANKKQYSINGGTLKDYTAPFEIDQNNAVIYAINQNEKGQSANSTYKIENIVPEPPIVVLDQGDYYIIHLNYPEISRTREYKWKVEGQWKTYNENGILLVKPQAKDKIIKGGRVEVEDETGKKIDYSDHYYLIDVPISKLNEVLFMRWDMVDPTIPIITPSTTDPARKVTIAIEYEQGSKQMQYKVILPGQSYDDVKWQKYTSAFEVNQKGTTVYARSEDEYEMWSKEAKYIVNNIDQKGPDISFAGDFEAATRTLKVKVTVTDNTGVNGIRYVKGLQNEDYFTNNGTTITNNETIDITENGTYTFYTDDIAGNKHIATLTITNIDNTSPSINILINPDNKITTKVDITIEYNDSKIKQYKIGETNNNWLEYNGKIELSSQQVISNNWKNNDNTVTIFAKGIDDVGNSTIIDKVINVLDCDLPSLPIINLPTALGYPTLYGDGIRINSNIADATITYDKRSDIENYYSIDNGKTWVVYNNSLNINGDVSKVIAKSVKKNGISVESSKDVILSTPSGVIGKYVYDGDKANGASYSNGTTMNLYVDSSAYGKLIKVQSNLTTLGYTYASVSQITISFLDKNGQIINKYEQVGVNNKKNTNTVVRINSYSVPNGTIKIRFVLSNSTYYNEKAYAVLCEVWL